MRTIAALSIGLCLLFAGTAQGQRRVRLRTMADSLAYYTGAGMALSMKKFYEDGESSLEFREKAFKAAFKEMWKGRGPDGETVNDFLANYYTAYLPAEELRSAEAWLAEVERTTPGIQRTESGLLYRIVEPGNSVRATGEDQVEVYFEGKLRSGKAFGIGHGREGGIPLTIQLNKAIAGWAEGLKLIGEGGTIRLWIHPALGHGAGGTSDIQPNAALWFEVELIDVKPAAEKG
ncbi:MAG: FKBP-type peptidyl-prolyl cis-trans isomerase [Bacteroidales bacterium]|jgi:FKBP-type peptidyl-prolyl cis-trans isomerase|nr:FKBP-type peptidyl-prolyl cis-trans isomerase [Bacteroidales bacterium]